MAFCNRFSAPNGEPSILYAALEQTEGTAKATQLWNWVYTKQFKEQYPDLTKDVNGEPVASEVLSLIQPNRNALQAGINWLKSIDPDNELNLVNGLIDDIARGSYDSMRDVITASIEYADKGTIKHEKFHQVFAKLPHEKREALLDEGAKLFGIERGESKTIVKYSQAQQNQINYVLKAVDILQSDKAKTVFEKGKKANWDLNKILTELAVPKEQKQLLLDLGITDREQLALELTAQYSYAIEVNTATQKIDRKYLSEMGYEQNLLDSEVDENKPSQYYSNLTVPGGTNYTENEISTPLITPSIKGHAQFSTDNGIGWFRSDEQVSERSEDFDEFYYHEQTGSHEYPPEQRFKIRRDYIGEEYGSKTRRILEMQSDLFQKGRNRKDLTKPYKTITKTPEVGFGEYGDPITEEFRNEEDIPKNQFLQLLNKDNNWVTLFIKSIIQDSAKKGYTKVLFPKGDTASKIEGHDTLEGFKKEKERAKKDLEARIEAYTQGKDRYTVQLEDGDYELTTNSKDEAEKSAKRVGGNVIDLLANEQRELDQLKAELERVEKEGFGALKPIWDFYENRVKNTLNKLFNTQEITDEFGNGWVEIDLSDPKVKEHTELIKFQSPKLAYTGDLAIEEKIAEMMENTPDEQLPKTALGRFIQALRNLLRNIFKERTKAEQLLRDINQGRYKNQNGTQVLSDKKYQQWQINLTSENVSVSGNQDHKPKYRIPMNFKDGDGGRKMRPEFAGKSTFELTKEGKRTATSRDLNQIYNQYNIQRGDIIEFYNNEGESVLVEATTGIYRLEGMTAEQWSKLEGWAPSEFDRVKKKGYGQFQFKLVSPTTGEEKQGAQQQQTQSETKPTIVEIPAADFNTTTEESFIKSLLSVYAKARNNPTIQYKIPFTPETRLEIEDVPFTMYTLANLLDREDAPHNVIYDERLWGLMQNLPKNFTKGMQFEDQSAPEMNELERTRQMDRFFVRVRDDNGNMTEEYFPIERQNEAINSIFYVLFNSMSKNPNWSVAQHREDIYKRLSHFKAIYQEIAEGTEYDDELKISPEQAKNMVENYQMVLNAYHVTGQSNNLWNFMLKRLDGHGIKMTKVDGSEITGNAIMQELNAIEESQDEGYVLEEQAGHGLRDFFDVSFEMDPADRASSRMKRFLMSIERSHFGTEEKPKEIQLPLPEHISPVDLATGKIPYRVLSPEQMNELGLKTPKELPTSLTETERKKATQGVARVNGQLLRVTADRLVTDTLLEYVMRDGRTFKDYMTAQEGIEPKVGDTLLRLVPYKATTDGLLPEKNFLGLPSLVNYTELYKKLTATLAGLTPSYEGYIQQLKATNDPDLHRVVRRLEAATDKSIQKGFVSNMSNQYQSQWLGMFKKEKDGFINVILMDANRSNEIDVLITKWQENQKVRGMLMRNAMGNTVVNYDLAMSLRTELEAIQNTKVGVSKGEWNKLSVQEQQKQRTKTQEQREELDTKKQEIYRKVLHLNGIDLHPEAMAEFLTGASGKKYGVPSQVIDLLLKKLTVGDNERDKEILASTGIESESYKSNNPLYTERKVLRKLALLERQYSKNLRSNTNRTVDKKTVYSIGLNTSLSHAVREITQNEAYRKRYESSPFARNSHLLEFLNESESNRENFKLVYLDGLKNFYGDRDGSKRPDMSMREQQLIALGLFQSNGIGEKANYLGLTHSDKTVSPVYLNAPVESVYETRDGKYQLSNHIIDKVYSHVFMSEYNRIQEHKNQETNLKGYDAGKKFFYTLPWFNYEMMKRMVDSKKLTETDLASIWLDKNTLNSVSNPLFRTVAEKLIRFQLTEMILATERSWHASGLLEAGFPGNPRYINHLTNSVGGIDTRYSKADVDKILTRLMAGHYTVNSFLFNVSLAQLFHGDPALLFKKSLEGTYVEYGKRLAKDIAPGTDGEFSHSPSYVTVTAADYTPIARELAKVKGFEGPVEATDAQEIVTVKEDLDVLYAFEQITEAQYNQALDIIKNAKDGYYKFPKELSDVIFQPRKPVDTGMRAPVNGVMRADYVKSAAFVLYPPFIKGMELDKLRRAMEDPETGVQRLHFATAKKIGAPKAPIQLFKADGTIDESVFKSEAWLKGSRQVMEDRSSFRIQQEVPYEEDKEAIKTLSQMNDNITQGIATINTKFNYKGEQISGKVLRKIKEDIRKQLITIQHQAFLNKVGAIEENGNLIFKDPRKLYKLLETEALKRKGYTLNDIQAIRSFVQNTDELVIPLMLTPSAARFESLMLSMIKDIVNVKMPGKSYVQISPAGFKSMKRWEDIQQDDLDIVFTDRFDGELKTAHINETTGEVVPAQVLAPFNFFDKYGNKLSINKFIKVVDGKRMLDTEKVPRELFQLIGARIPNQGHSSMLPIEIVGFIPEEMGDTIVVPAAITKQMGADFDVDKLYTYKRAYRYDKGRFTVVGEMIGNDKDHVDYLKNQYMDIHWSVLTNTEMFDRMMQALDRPDLSEEADLLSGNNSIPYYFSPTYQLQDFESMQMAKSLVAATALSVGNNAKVEDKNIIIGQDEMVDGAVKTVERPITLLDLTGKREIHLSRISGYGQTTYKGRARTKADNLIIQESEAVDHAKNRVIDRLNLNSYTYPASAAMSRLQSPDLDNEPGETLDLRYNTRLLMQPIVLEFSQEMAKSADSLSGSYAPDQVNTVITKLKEKYTAKILELHQQETGAAVTETAKLFDKLNQSFVKKSEDTGELFVAVNPDILLETINMPRNAQFYYRQLMLIGLFENFHGVGTQLQTLQKISSQVTRGAGKDMLSAISVAERRAKFHDSALEFEYNVLNYGSAFYHEDELTEVGVTYKATIDTARNLYQDELPYERMEPLYNFISEHTGRVELTIDMKRSVIKSLKSSIFAQNRLGLWSDGYQEKLKLMFSLKGRKSLAERVLMAQETWGKNDYLLQRLTTKISPDNIQPHTISYDAAKAEETDDYENTRSWLNLLNSEDPVKKQLGEDLIRYSLLTGGVQSANNFVQYIPFSYLAGTEIAPALREAFSKIDTIAINPAFREQWFQHYPEYAKQLGEALEETGKRYERAPDTFILPLINLDSNTTNPAINLQIKTTAQDGKKAIAYPLYLSYRDKVNNRWLLYKQQATLKDGFFYARIDTLGNSEMSEFTETVSELRSVIASNRSSWYENISSQPIMLSNKAIDFMSSKQNTNTVLRQIGIFSSSGGYKEMVHSLQTIASDPQQATYLRTISNMLLKLERMPVEKAITEGIGFTSSFKFDLTTNDRVLGIFDTHSNTLLLNQNTLRTKQTAAETVVHELVHYHTAFIVSAFEDEALWDQKGFNAATKNSLRAVRNWMMIKMPEVAAKIKALDEVRQLAYNELKSRMTLITGETAWNEAVANSKKNIFQDEVGKLLYALHSNTEFVTHIMSDPTTMKFLNSIEYKGEKTLLEHIKDLIAEFWSAFMEAMGAKKDSLLEESLKRGLNLILYQQESTFADTFQSDQAAFIGSLSNASINSGTLTAIDNVLGKLREQESMLKGSLTEAISSADRIDKRRKLQVLQEDILLLENQRTLEAVVQIAKKELKWVKSVSKDPKASSNQINTSLKMIDTWREIIQLVYGDSAAEADPELAEIAKEATAETKNLIRKSKEYLNNISDGLLTARDWDKDLVDVNKVAGNIRSLGSAASSKAIQFVADYVETTGRMRNEEVYKLSNELDKLEADMDKLSGGKLKFYDKLLRKRKLDDPEIKDQTWGMVTAYSVEWEDWLKTLARDRVNALSILDKNDPVDRTKRRVVWRNYWKQLKSKAIYLDTRILFDETTGELRTGIEEYIKTLKAEVGEDHANKLIREAQAKFKRYLEDREVSFEQFQREFDAGELTIEELNAEMVAFQEKYSPNWFFDLVEGNGHVDGEALDKYIIKAPKAKETDFWDQNYKEIMADNAMAALYNRYKTIRDQLMSYLPISKQAKAGESFLPSIDKAMITANMNIMDWIRNMPKRFVNSVAASEYEQAISKRVYKSIPIEFTDPGKVDIDDKSRDLIGIARLFGMMALHYKHFSAAIDVIEMGESVLKEIDRIRSVGGQQVEQNGRLVTTKAGLKNAIEMLEYLKNYSVYRQPKELEYSGVQKLYAERKEGKKVFNLSPINQRKISKRIKKLIAERDELYRKFINQETITLPDGTEVEEVSMEEYDEKVGKINAELSKYEGFTIYGSKIGDKLITINQLKTLSFNPFSAIANMTFGVISVAIHSSGQTDFNFKEAMTAFRMMINSFSKWASFGAINNAAAHKIVNVMDKMGVIGDFIDSTIGKPAEVRHKKSTVRKIIDPWSLMRSGDYFMKGLTTIAVLLNRKVKVTVDGKEKSISVWDALDQDGNWNEALYGKNSLFDSENRNSDWNKLKNRVVRVNMVLHGNQDKEAPKMFNKVIVGRLLGQFRLSWLPEGWYNRTQKAKYDIYLERWVKGRYRSALEIGLGGVFKILGRNLLSLIPGVKIDNFSGIQRSSDGKPLEEVDIENMRRNMAELYAYMGILIMIMMIRSLRDDDDTEDTRGLQLLINMLIRNQQDIGFYASPEIFDTVTRNIVPATTVLKDYWGLVVASGRILMEDDYEFEKWLLKFTKAGLPIPQTNLINKTKFMLERDIGDVVR